MSMVQNNLALSLNALPSGGKSKDAVVHCTNDTKTPDDNLTTEFTKVTNAFYARPNTGETEFFKKDVNAKCQFKKESVNLDKKSAV